MSFDYGKTNKEEKERKVKSSNDEEGSEMEATPRQAGTTSRQGGTTSRQGGATSRQGETTPRQSGSVSAIIVQPAPYLFSDPCPQSMRHVRIADLSSVDINWKMLTLARPTTKIDEEIFSK